MLIRKANVEDLDEIDKIYLEGVTDEIKIQFPSRSKSDIIKEMNQARKKRLSGFNKEMKSGKKNLWLVAEINNKIIGFANAEIKDKKEGALTMLYITKPYRKQGIGKRLTSERITWLKKKKVKEISAGILINNINSIKNLENFGFEKTSLKMVKKIK
ncbi:MAG: GNAT family N-acetyltransferase [Nanoarchaeota archaeon]|mgnify:CR=1 FL=1